MPIPSLPGRVITHARLIAVVLLTTCVASAQIVFTTQPKGVVVTAGQPASFNVTVAGAGPYSYQWRRRSYALAGATTATLTMPAVTQGESDLYDVVVTGAAGSATSEFARLQVTPTSYPGASAVDLLRSLRLESTDTNGFQTLSTSPDGQVYLVGNFTSVGGQARSFIVRLKPDGTVDSTFTSPKFDTVPFALAVQSDGKILVGGNFRTVDGVALAGLVRLNPNGTRDASFTPATEVGTGVERIFVGLDGRIYLPGYFPLAQGAWALKLLPSGGLDPAFDPAAFTSEGNRSDPFIYGFDAATGKLYVAGRFDRINGALRAGLARLLPGGGLDLGFDPGAGTNATIYQILVLSSGKVILAGDFTSYNRLTAGRIARVNPDGSLDTTFVTGTGFSLGPYAVELPGGQMFVRTGGAYNGTSPAYGIRLNANGSRDNTFTYPFTATPVAAAPLAGNRLLVQTRTLDLSDRPSTYILEANGTESSAPRLQVNYAGHVTMLTSAPGGKIVVAGDFTTVNGIAARHVLRLNADLTRDATFPVTAGPSDIVHSGTVQPDGKLLLFTTNGLIRFNTDGSVDASFATAGGASSGFRSNAPVILPDGRILIATANTAWGNSAVTNGYVILDANGTRLTTHPLLPGPPAGSRAYGAQVLPGGQILIVGVFTSWNGVACNGAVRLNRDGSVDRSFSLDQEFNPATTGSVVTGSAAGPSYQRDGRVIALAAGFTNIQFGPNLVRLAADGSRDRTFAAPLAVTSSPQYLVQGDDRIIYAGGKDRPAPYGGTDPVHVRFEANGNLDPTFAIYGSGTWQKMWIADNGELLSSDDTGYLHRYSSVPPPTIITQPVASTGEIGTTTTLAVSATSAFPLTYQWQKNGVSVLGATNATLALDNLQPATAGSYTVVITAGGRSVTSQTAVVTVLARSPANTYFGQLGNGSGTFSLALRNDGTGVFLAYLSTSKTALLSREVTMDAQRRLRASVSASPTGSLTELGIEALLAPDGTLSGSITPLGVSFFAAPPASPPPASPAGFYEAFLSGSSSTVSAVVGPAGDVFVVVQASTTDRGQGKLDASGNFTIATVDGVYDVRGVAKAGAVLWSPVVTTRSTGRAAVFQGANNDARTDVEKLINVSTRSMVAAGGGSFTIGFVITGTQSKPVLVRGVGPTLGAFQVGGALPAVRLEVYRGSTSIAVGNDWSAAPDSIRIPGIAARVGAFALPPGSRDAALVLTLDPGVYSVVVSGQGGASGIALAEVYDATDGAIPRGQRIINLSTRAFAGDGESVLSAGFVVNGTVPKRLLIRGAGPALAPFGVSGVLARPQLTVYSGNTVLASNTGWTTASDAAGLAAAAKQVGAFAFADGSADAALVVYLAPGDYSAQVSGIGSSTGVALVEVYELP